MDNLTPEEAANRLLKEVLPSTIAAANPKTKAITKDKKIINSIK